MSNLSNYLLRATFSVLLGSLLAPVAHADKFPGIGRPATEKEVAAWNIDVRPDFQGLPKGSGSAQVGGQIWEARCATCHGSFGESNSVFTPIVGGTTKDDIASGHVASLVGNSQPQRTTMMKLANLSTLWDYIRRAMPWNAPRSLKPDEVYALTAYILNMAEVVPDDFVLSDQNIRQTQDLLPNRKGLTTEHGMWTVDGKPDVHNTRCMKDCVDKLTVSSSLPDFARNAHGDLAQQNRTIGPVRGTATAPAVTTKTETTAPALGLLSKNGCTGCHAVDTKILGPAFREIANRYGQAATSQDKTQLLMQNLTKKIRSGGQGVWGNIPMPAQTAVSDQELQEIVHWLIADKAS